MAIWIRAATLAAGLMLAAAPAGAQLTQFPTAPPPPQPDRPGRPFKPLFGPESSGRQNLHSIDLSLALEVASDNAMFNEAASGPSPVAGGGDFNEAYTGGTTLSYSRRGDTLTLGMNVGAYLPYYPTFDSSSFDAAYNARANAGVKGRRTSLSASADYSRSPYYTLMFDSPLIGGQGVGGPLDFSTAASPLQRGSATGSLHHEFTRETSGSISYTQSAGLFIDEYRDSRNRTLMLSIEHQQLRTVQVHAGYSASFGAYSRETGRVATTGQGGDVGLSWTPRPRRNRSTTLAANLGLYHYDNGSGRNTRTQWSVRGQRTIGGSWSAGLDYSRRMRTYDVLAEPTWADVVVLQVSGQPHRRINIGLSGNYSEDLATTTESIRLSAGTVRLRFALSSLAALDLGGTYVNYRFPAGYDLPAGMWQAQERTRVQVGLSMWLPVARFGRAPSGAAAGQ